MPPTGTRSCPRFLGLAISRHFADHRTEQERLRLVAFAFLLPFFFIKGGFNVSRGAVFANLGVLGLLFAAKMLPKLGFPARAPAHTSPRHLRDPADGHRLTLGTISSLFALNDGTQFSLLVTVVVASALIPTAIAQTFFHPIADLERRGRPIPAEEYV
jgi:hypothetical protein